MRSSMFAIPLKLSRSTQLFIFLLLVFIASTFLLPANPLTKSTYNFNDTQYHLVLFMARIPYIMAWIAIFMAFRSLVNYTKRIIDTPEGTDFLAITKGMRWIAWGGIIPLLLSTFLYAIANGINPDFRASAIILTNYFYVIIALVAFTYISSGAHTLSLRSKAAFNLSQVRVLIFLLVGLSVLFCLLIAGQLQMESLGHSFNSYYLPNWLIWVTIVVPYLFAWFVGLYAALLIIKSAHSTSGVIYRQALQLVAVGLFVTIVGLVARQYFTSIVPRTGHLTIGFALIMTYSVYAVQAAGAVLLVIGAKRLQKIEEI